MEFEKQFDWKKEIYATKHFDDIIPIVEKTVSQAIEGERKRLIEKIKKLRTDIDSELEFKGNFVGKDTVSDKIADFILSEIDKK